MASDNTIRIFTALDIEKYHKGLLSAKERHDLEKAALDDPFLADALEGYAVAGVDAKADIIDLRNRLAEKTTQAKVVSMNTGTGKRAFPWFRAAAMFVLVAGAGFLVYQLGFKKSSSPEIAQVSTNKNEEKAVPDSNVIHDRAGVAPGTFSIDTSQKLFLNSEQSKDVNNNAYLQKTNVGGAHQWSLTDSTALANTQSSLTVAPSGNMDILTNKPVLQKMDSGRLKGDVIAADKNQFGTVDFNTDNVAKKKEAAPSLPKAKEASIDSQTKETTVLDGYAMNDKRSQGITSKTNPVANRKLNEQYYKYSNTFRGLVTDANNNALPFANVTNVQDNIGTYADAKGNFVLTSTDSVMNVQVRSNGFNSSNIQLRNNIPSSQIVLQEDKNLAVQTLRPGKVNYERRRDANMKLEGEPEPEDGWYTYDSYLSNNLNIDKEALRGKQNTGGSVDVSFEVNKNGEPVNFKIEKSLCDKCDQEAIRLIKEGPKWKRKAKKGRTTVTISF
jgi:hypothetical protein